MVISARGKKGGLRKALRHIEAQYVAIEPQRTLEVGDFQMNVPNADARIDCCGFAAIARCHVQIVVETSHCRIRYHSAMLRVKLIHWKDEAIERAAKLREAGFAVDVEPLQGAGSLKHLREDPPVAFVIDLSRLPSHGREVALALRQTKATRAIPLVFVDGEDEKVRRIRLLLPDATFTKWKKIGRDLRRAIASPRREPVMPPNAPAGYSGTPLPKKLGIKEGSAVGLFGAPKDFKHTLGELPAGARLQANPRAGSRCDVVLCFAKSMKELAARTKTAVKRSSDSGLWLIWPKKTSGVVSDLSEDRVRNAGLAAGWVDYKVCAVDATWSGLKFARRKNAKPKKV